MIYVIVTIIIIAIVLFVLSFYMHDKLSELEGQIEDISLSNIQESYQMNKKINILEEELLIGQFDMVTTEDETNNKLQIPTIQKIKELHSKGIDILDIAKETGFSTNDIKAIIQDFK